MALPVADIVQREWRSNPNIPLGPNVITTKANRSHSASLTFVLSCRPKIALQDFNEANV
jgi:hypothetical protein